MRLTTARDLLKVPSTLVSTINSTHSSATPSPTLSTQESRISTGFSTSVSDPDDYVDMALPQTVTPAPIKARSTTSSKPSPEPGKRRASGRLRKPTAKAQAISEESTSPSQLLDTIVIGGSPPRKPEDQEDAQPSTPPSPRTAIINTVEPDLEIEIPETPAHPMNDNPTTFINGEGADGGPLTTPTAQSPSRRHSRRERKPTAKILETSPTTTKRPASDVHDVHEEPPRKSARVSYSGAKVPSKLRYSVSSTSTDSASPKNKEIGDPPSAKQSLIVILKVPRLAKSGKGKTANASRNSKLAKHSPRRTRNSTHQQKVSPTKSKTQVPIITTALAKELPPSCLLSCLSPSSRLLAMAQIALMMPDSNDDDDAEILPGSDQDWRTYVPQVCQCHNNQDALSSRTNSVDLQRALEPNPLSDGTQFAPIQLPSSPTPELDFLAAPVNTILKVGEAERVKEFFSNNATMSMSNSFSTPENAAFKRKRSSMPLSAHLNGNTLAAHSPVSGFLSVPAKSSYEDRLRKDHLALSDIRKRAGMMGIRWSFNMTFDQIHDLVMEVESQQEEAHMHSQARSFGRRMTTSSYENEEAPRSRHGFGMLLPSQTSTNGLGNGESSRQGQGRASIGGKGSRPRIDLRGLLGESPGPGTIINIEDRRRGGSRASKKSRIN
ncbi:hypothetical protein LTR84_000249 [Exophiala bonariae]|uniref:Uncharacterized protein n=1 Tax=Exophiala bonariae TaxID=1690606 RepID=A0AAV9NQ18_9EURO|nr:hypothetical protein LTR84_000249 [Exophiala bonariae]